MNVVKCDVVMPVLDVLDTLDGPSEEQLRALSRIGRNLAWLLQYINIFILQFCTLCRIHPFVVDIVTWLAWSNSSYNPILYSWFSKEYRQMYKRMFGCGNRNRLRLPANMKRCDRNGQTVNATGIEVPTQVST
jgi:hypothetical protein